MFAKDRWSHSAFFSARTENISPEEEYKIACLLMVFVAVSLPTLASNVMSQYSPAIEGIHDLKFISELVYHISMCEVNYK